MLLLRFCPVLQSGIKNIRHPTPHLQKNQAQNQGHPAGGPAHDGGGGEAVCWSDWHVRSLFEKHANLMSGGPLRPLALGGLGWDRAAYQSPH